jgi:chromosome segregation ATPase
MFKKLAIASLAVLAGLMIWHKTSVGSYLNCAWKKAKATATNAVPLEWEIDRLREEVSNLVPDMKKQLSSIAEEKVAIDRLGKEIAVARTNLKDQEENIKTMRADLKNLKPDETTVSYGTGKFKVERVKEKLAKDWQTFRLAEENLKNKEQLLEARKGSLDAALQKLAEMKTRKEQMEVEVAKLELKLKELRVAEARNKFHVDDSQLSKCQQMLDDINARIDTEITTNALQGQFVNDQIPVGDKVKAAKAIEEIDQRYGEVQSAKTENGDK